MVDKRTYSIAFSSSPGVHNVEIWFDNNIDDEYGDRNLIVESLAIDEQVGVPAPAHCGSTWSLVGYALIGDFRVPLGGISFATSGKPAATVTSDATVDPETGDVTVNGVVDPPFPGQDVTVTVRYPSGSTDIIDTETQSDGSFSVPLTPEERGPVTVTADLPRGGGPFAPVRGEDHTVDVCVPVGQSCDDGIQNAGEVGVDCGGPCPPCGPSCEATTYQAENMFHSTGSAIAGGWALWTNGHVSTDHAFTGSEDAVTVVAKGTPALGVWPRMVVKIGGEQVGEAFVNSSVWAPYTFDLEAPPSTPEKIRVSFTNDKHAPPADRNLFLDQVTTECGDVQQPGACAIASAFDVGVPGSDVSVTNDACLKVENGYPEWWDIRTMKLETAPSGSYPVPFTWSNSCSGSGGSGLFTGDWQARLLSVADSNCATLINLMGSGSGNVTVRYWAE